MSFYEEFHAHKTLNRDKLRRDLWRHFHRNGLRSDEELDFFIQEYLKYRIPRTSFCNDCSPPFSLISDMFFERYEGALGWASRSSGKTRLVSILNYLDLDFKAKCDIAHAGATLDQTNRAYRYFCSYLAEPLVNDRVTNSIKSYTEFCNGSTLEIVTGNVKGLNSPHTNKLRLDEVELMDWEALEEAASITISKHGYKAQDVLTSTRKYAKGPMSRLIREAVGRGLHLYSWCIWDVLERCNRDCVGDPVYGDCPAYERVGIAPDGTLRREVLCGGKAHNCSGWYKISDFLKKVRGMDWATFRTQWLNKEPSGAKLVYGDCISSEVHKFNWDRFEKLTGMKRPPDHWKRISGVDFGSQFAYQKFAIAPKDVLGGMMFMYYEYFHDSDQFGVRLLSEHAKVIKSSPDWSRKEVVYCDSADKQAIAEFKAMGINAVPSVKDVMLGINAVKEVLKVDSVTGLPRLMIHEDCSNFWREVENYSHPEDKDGTVDYDDIVDEFNHSLDATRYAIHTHLTNPVVVKYGTARIKGVR